MNIGWSNAFHSFSRHFAFLPQLSDQNKNQRGKKFQQALEKLGRGVYWLDIVNNYLELVPEFSSLNDIALGVCYSRELSALFWIVFRTNLCSINIIAGQDDGMPEGYFKVQKSAKSSVVGCPEG